MSRHQRIFFGTLAALVLGALTGWGLGPAAAPLGELSKLVVQALKCAAIPLLGLAIVDAILKASFSGRGLRLMLTISSINAVAAITIGLAIVNLTHPGRALSLAGTGGAAGKPAA